MAPWRRSFSEQSKCEALKLVALLGEAAIAGDHENGANLLGHGMQGSQCGRSGHRGKRWAIGKRR